jgi:hypothetical protein
MTISIDPIRRAPGPSRSRKGEADTDRADLTQATAGSLLPVPVGPPRTIPRSAARVGGASAIDAQVIGERRGLRAGPQIHDQARVSYNRTAWSGSADRRAPTGRSARTEI